MKYCNMFSFSIVTMSINVQMPSVFIIKNKSMNNIFAYIHMSIYVYMMFCMCTIVNKLTESIIPTPKQINQSIVCRLGNLFP